MSHSITNIKVEEYKIKNIEEMQDELTSAIEELRAELQGLYVQQGLAIPYYSKLDNHNLG